MKKNEQRAESLKKKLDALVIQMSDLIDGSMPYRGDTCEVSQKVCLKKALGDMYKCIAGIEPEDFEAMN